MAPNKKKAARTASAGKAKLGSEPTPGGHETDTVVPAGPSTSVSGLRHGQKRKNQGSEASPGALEELNRDLLPGRLFATDRYPQKGRINSYSRPEYLVDIVEALVGTEQYEWLMASRFGRLFELPVRKSSVSGKLVHQLVCRSLVTAKKHEMWFVFGGHPIRFSLREFGIITGLNCEPYPSGIVYAKLSKPGARDKPFIKTLIGSKNSYSIVEVVNMLRRDKKLPEVDRMEPARRLQLALVIIVDGILVCNSSNLRVSEETVEMVKEVEAFEKYPWGRKSFERTIEMVKVGKHVENVDALISKLNTNSHVATHGFTLALQLLILQAAPILERYIPDPEDERNFTDRSVLQLTLLKTFHNSNILEAELDSNLVVKSILHTEDTRDIQEYDFADEVEDAGVEYMLNKIQDEYEFKRDDWQGGDEDLPLITVTVPPINEKRKKAAAPPKPTVEKKRKGKKTISAEDNVAAESSGQASGMHPDYATAEDLLREVDRRNNENRARIQEMLILERDALRDEIVDDVLKTLREKGVFKSVNITQEELVSHMKKSSWVIAGDSGERNIPGSSARRDNPGSSAAKGNPDGKSVPEQGVDNNEEEGLYDYGLDNITLGEIRDKCDDPNIGVKGNPTEASDDSEESDDAVDKVDDAVDKVADDEEMRDEDKMENVDSEEMRDEDKMEENVDDEEKEDMEEKKKEEDVLEKEGEEDEEEMAEKVDEEKKVVEDGKEEDEEVEEEEKLEEEDDKQERGGNEENEENEEDEEDEENQEDEEDEEMEEEDDKGVDGKHGEKEIVLCVEDGGQNVDGQETQSGEEAADGQVEGKMAAATKKRKQKIIEEDLTPLPAKRPRKQPKRLGTCSTSTKKKAKVESEDSEYNPFPVVKPATKKKFLTLLGGYDEEEYSIDRQVVPKSFFEELYTPTHWVDSPHMEAMLNLLWRRHGESFLESRVAILDTWFTDRVTIDYGNYQKLKKKAGFQWNSLIRNYVRGLVSSRAGKMAWFKDVDTVYMPMNWRKRHWVALAINLRKGEIIILDPLIVDNHLRSLPRLMKPLLESLPIIIKEFVDPADIGVRPPKSFSFMRIKEVYQNDRTGDCGPLTVKFMELHAKGLAVDDMTEEMVDDMRMHFAVSVYEEFVVKFTG